MNKAQEKEIYSKRANEAIKNGSAQNEPQSTGKSDLKLSSSVLTSHLAHRQCVQTQFWDKEKGAYEAVVRNEPKTSIID